MPRWIQTLLIAVLGLVAGLIYGWNIAPVEYVDTTPDTLHAEYRSDYVLMVAEAYQSEGNLELAARRLALLGSAHPAEIAAKALAHIQENDPTETDVERLKKLIEDIKPWQPSLEEIAP